MATGRQRNDSGLALKLIRIGIKLMLQVGLGSRASDAKDNLLTRTPTRKYMHPPKTGFGVKYDVNSTTADLSQHIPFFE
jgi:hypothetical protein